MIPTKYIKNGRVQVTRACKELNISKEELYLQYKGLEKRGPGNGLCVICGSDTKLENFKKGFRRFCSVKCAMNSKDTKAKFKQTMQERYGAEHPLKVPEIKNQMLETFASKYPSGHLFSEKEFVERNKTNPDRIKKWREAFQKNGSYQSRQIRNSQDLTLEYILEHFVENGRLKYQEALEHFKITPRTFNRYRAKFNIGVPAERKPAPAPKSFQEFIESLGIQDVKFNNTDYGRELDIFIPSKRLAIEYNGLLWHSFGTTFPNNIHTHAERRYHLRDKLDYFESRGVHLLNIFENEWLDPRTRSIWESVIRYKLGLVQKRLYARECQVVRVTDSKFVQEFMNQNHLQGAGGGYPSLVYGLEHNNEIVALMTFGPSRFDRTAEWELLRFCTAKNTAVVGGAQKLFKYFLRDKKPASVISYANRRWSNGRVYEILGFTRTHISAPNYFWFRLDEIRHTQKLRSRNEFQKYKLKDLFPDFWDPMKPSSQILHEAGYRRVYDCGNIVYRIGA